MVLGKIYRCAHKTDKESVVSILLEHRHDKHETLLFEAEAVAILCKPLYSLLSLLNYGVESNSMYSVFSFPVYRISISPIFANPIAAATEAEAVRHLYTTVTDAYGCLGVMQIAVGKLKPMSCL